MMEGQPIFFINTRITVIASKSYLSYPVFILLLQFTSKLVGCTRTTHGSCWSMNITSHYDLWFISYCLSSQPKVSICMKDDKPVLRTVWKHIPQREKSARQMVVLLLLWNCSQLAASLMQNKAGVLLCVVFFSWEWHREWHVRGK